MEKENSDILSWEDIRDHALWWVRFVARALSFSRSALIRYRMLTWPLIIAGAGLAIGILYQRSKEYSMTTTYVYGDLHPKIFGDMIDKLNAAIGNNRTAKVAEVTGLTETQAAQFLRFKVTDTRGRPLSQNYTMRKEPLILTVYMSRPIAEDSLRSAVSRYFNGNNPFTADRLELKMKLLRDELGYINAKLQTIDTVLQNLYVAPPSPIVSDKGVTVESSEGKNAYELLNFSRDLMKRKGEVESSLSFPENVIPIDNFLVFPRANLSIGSIAKYGTAGAMAGFAIAWLILLVRIYVAPLVRDEKGR